MLKSIVASSLILAALTGLAASQAPMKYFGETIQTTRADAHNYLERMLPYIFSDKGPEFNKDRFWVESYNAQDQSGCVAQLVTYKSGIDFNTSIEGIFQEYYRIDYNKLVQIWTQNAAHGNFVIVEGLVQFRTITGQWRTVDNQRLVLKHEGIPYDIPKALRFLAQKCGGGSSLR